MQQVGGAATAFEIPDWSLLQSASVDTASGRSALRKGIVKPLLLRGDFKKAYSVLEVILERSGETKDFLQLARLQQQAGEPDRAVSTLRSARRAAPLDIDIARAYLAACLKLEEASIAADAAHEVRHFWEKDGSIADHSARALYRSGDMTGALAAADASVSLNKQNSAAITFAASVYNAAGQASTARDTLMESPGGGAGQSGKRAFELARALFQLDPASEKARSFLSGCYASEPTNYRYAHLYASCLYSRGEYECAVEVIESARTMERSFVAAVLYAKCLRQLRRYDEAIDVLEPIVADAGVMDSVLRFAMGVYLMAGRQTEAMALAERARNAAVQRMPSDVSTALSNLSSELHTADIRPARLDWAWQHVRALAKSPIDRQSWENDARWVTLADSRFRDCLEHVPSEHAAIAELIEGVDPIRTALSEARQYGKGALLATAHVGALFAGPITMAETGLPVSIVASTPDLNDGRVPHYENARLISAASNDVVTLSRTILRHLSENRVVVIAIDGTSFPGLPQFELFDRSIALSDFVPRRVFKAGTPSFYGDVRWDDGKLYAHVTALPQPMKARGESEADFVSRWMDQYVEHIAQLFAKSPHNLRMSGGFWNTIKM